MKFSCKKLLQWFIRPHRTTKIPVFLPSLSHRSRFTIKNRQICSKNQTIISILYENKYLSTFQRSIWYFGQKFGICQFWRENIIKLTYTQWKKVKSEDYPLTMIYWKQKRPSLSQLILLCYNFQDNKILRSPAWWDKWPKEWNGVARILEKYLIREHRGRKWIV